MHHNMTDKDIINFCSTEENCLKYIDSWINSNKGYYNCCYMEIDKIPALQSLVQKGTVVQLNNRLYKGCLEFTYPKHIKN